MITQYSKSACEHCGGEIKFNVSHVGMSLKCPHCFEPTKLLVPANAKLEFPPPGTPAHELWKFEPVSEKQKAMLVLYGIDPAEGLSKGEAAELIDRAVKSRPPSSEGQAQAGLLFGKIRLETIIGEINKAIETIGDESAKITELKEAKKSVNDSVRALTGIIDMRIEGIRHEKLYRD